MCNAGTHAKKKNSLAVRRRARGVFAQLARRQRTGRPHNTPLNQRLQRRASEGRRERGGNEMGAQCVFGCVWASRGEGVCVD